MNTPKHLPTPDRRSFLKSMLAASAAPLVVSEALIRLPVSANTTPALLACGSRDPKRFTPGQSTELLQFLGECLAAMIRCLVMNRGARPPAGGG